MIGQTNKIFFRFRDRSNECGAEYRELGYAVYSNNAYRLWGKAALNYSPLGLLDSTAYPKKEKPMTLNKTSWRVGHALPFFAPLSALTCTILYPASFLLLLPMPGQFEKHLINKPWNPCPGVAQDRQKDMKASIKPQVRQRV